MKHTSQMTFPIFSTILLKNDILSIKLGEIILLLARKEPVYASEKIDLAI